MYVCRSRSLGFVFVRRTNATPSKWSKAGDGSTTFPSEINMRIVEFGIINANQKIDESIVCGLGEAALCQMRPFTLMFGPIHNSVIACDFPRACFHADFFWELPIDAFNFNL